jgi:hypothetical protein
MENTVKLELPQQIVSAVSSQCRTLALHAATRTCPISKLMAALDRLDTPARSAEANGAVAWAWLSDAARGFARTFDPKLKITPGLPGCQLLSPVSDPHTLSQPQIVEAVEHDVLACMEAGPSMEEIAARPELQDLLAGMPEPEGLAARRADTQQFLQRLRVWHESRNVRCSKADTLPAVHQ